MDTTLSVFSSYAHLTSSTSFDTTLAVPAFPVLAGDMGVVIQIIFIWVLTTGFYILAKKNNWQNWNFGVPCTNLTMGQFIGVIIAVVSGILTTIVVGLFTQQSLATGEVWREGLKVVLWAIGLHGAGGKFISAKVERWSGITPRKSTPPNKGGTAF